MIPKLVTFDCAGTMVAVPKGWSMGWFAAEAAKSAGVNLPAGAAEAYQSLYNARLREFVAVNMSRNAELQVEFWRKLATDWFSQLDLPTEFLDPMLAEADVLGFGPDSILFKMFDDVIPCLDKLDSMGIPAAVISNWDYSLPRVLRIFGIEHRFITITASLVEGVEKPDRRLFDLTLARAGFNAAETVHVGDDWVDDVDGAQGAGLKPIFLDRSRTQSDSKSICTLADLTEAFDWID